MRHRGGGQLRGAPLQAPGQHPPPLDVLHRRALLRLRLLNVRLTGI